MVKAAHGLALRSWDSCILPFNFGECQMPGDPKMCLKMGYTPPVTILMGNEIFGQPISDKSIGTVQDYTIMVSVE